MSESRYAVIEAQGLQFRVAQEEEHILPRLDAEPGAEITFDRVLLLADGTSFQVGRPTVPGAEVRAQVIGETRGKKIAVFQYKRRKKYRKKIGYRDTLTRVRILDIRG